MCRLVGNVVRKQMLVPRYCSFFCGEGQRVGSRTVQNRFFYFCDACSFANLSSMGTFASASMAGMAEFRMAADRSSPNS